MDILGFPALLFIGAIILIVVGSVGERGPVLYNAIFRRIGWLGISAVIYYAFRQYAPDSAVRLFVPLLVVAVVTRIIIWLVRRQTEPQRKTIGRL